MRSTPKITKPPPPVPPRPSKTLVAEALAKTRKSPENVKNTPVRTAPPPPNDINRSKSTVTILVPKPVPLERSISESVKTSTRTVVFQSPKIESGIKKVNSFRQENQPKILEKKESFRQENKPKILEKKESFRQENKPKILEKKESFEDEKKKEIFEDDSEEMLNDRNHVNTLIDEMFASVLEVSSGEEESNKITINTAAETNLPTVVVVDDPPENKSSNSSTIEKKTVQFDDRLNHELLISELESMRVKDEQILKRQRKPSQDIYDSDSDNKISHSDWVEVNDGQEVRLSSCQITIEDLKNEDTIKLDYERIKAMSSLHGLPPLPKSLSGFNLLDGQSKPPTPIRTTSIRGQTPPHLVYPPHPKLNGTPEPGGRKSTNLDTQLAILRREMYSLRQLDLSLLSQLWSLNESIQDFRQILQEQDDRVLSPPSPSPVASSGDEGEGDEFYMSASSMNYRTPPPPPPVRRPSSSSNASSLG